MERTPILLAHARIDSHREIALDDFALVISRDAGPERILASK
jgi:hypothetical protein